MILDFLEDKKLIKEIISQKNTKYYKNSNDYFDQFIIASDYLNGDKTIFVTLPNMYEAQKYYDQLSQLLGEDSVLFYPIDQGLTTFMALGSPEFKNERIYTLRKLMTNEKYCVVTTSLAICQRQLKVKDYDNALINLRTNDNINLEKLIKSLIYSGYQKVFTVEKPGEFASRGSILDVYPLDSINPYRIDFFGNIIETIKSFDVETQRSRNTISSLFVYPMHELFYTDELKDIGINKIRAFFSELNLSNKENIKLEEDISNIDNRQKTDTLGIYISFFNEEITTILDFSKNYKTYFIDIHKSIINEDQLELDLETFSKTLDGTAFKKISIKKELKAILEVEEYTAIDNLGLNSLNYDAADLKIQNCTNYNGNIEAFNKDNKKRIGDKWTIILNINKPQNYERIVKELKELDQNINFKQIVKNEITIVSERFNSSFVWSDEKIAVFDDEILFSSKIRGKIRYRSVLNQSVKIRNVDELNEGDYVVHYDYGIGQYLGLKTMNLSGERDCLQIKYLDDEVLYVPVDQINLVLKYSSYEGMVPKLSKIGSKQWDKTKAQARMKIKDLSDRLIKLYAQRNKSLGYVFKKDDEMQSSFENDFLYEETLDQRLAIQMVKSDMQSDKVMDRLICGDVGFGKTEVALRAAFKAVLSGKQVAYLVPTTVLARQHYYTFKERFEKYGANIALMSRFTSGKKQKENIEKLSKGYVDVVIGTHRLLSKDIKFKDLGLFIIDEEQRFGVEHKEKIKEIKVNVDTLILSATPIPRTLQMSMMGLKDLSMIETPPLNRYPVQTYVVERNDYLVKEAIERELARGGQIFYLYNKVDTMQSQVMKLQKLVPSARIAFAHGKMSKNDLEDVLSDFIDHEFDVLVSTTIIETGVDIPNTNTLIIHDADKLGLSQLYQIRGRVGRSDKIAYAYLLFDKYKNINDEALKRLSAIKDFTELGSGYKIALRDLSIRGAGDILGGEQSGFIDSVGIELYSKLLEEALTGEIIDSTPIKDNDEIYATRHIKKEYINNDAVRIEIHKKIGKLNSINNLIDLKDELVDRFGELDEEIILYMYEKLYKSFCGTLKIEKTNIEKDGVTMILSIEGTNKIDGQKLFEHANKSKFNIKLGYLKERVSISIYKAHKKGSWLYDVCGFLDEFIV